MRVAENLGRPVQTRAGSCATEPAAIRLLTAIAMEQQPTGPVRPMSGSGHEATADPWTHDVHWAAELRSAIGVASLLFTALFVVDAASGRLEVTRGLLWSGLAFLIFAIMLPHRGSPFARDG